MMRVAAILTAILTLLIAAGAGAQSDQEEPEIVPPPVPQRVVGLVAGCNNVALTYPDGTSVDAVVGSIQPLGAMYAIWRLNPSPPAPATGPRYEGFAPAAREASDLEGVNFLEAVFLCVSVPATVTMPAVQPWPYPIPLPGPTVGPQTPP